MNKRFKDTQIMISEECDDIKALLLKKNIEYGDSAINPKRIFSRADNIEQINVRIDDKLSRIMYKGCKTIGEDTVLDLLGYLILRRVAQKYNSMYFLAVEEEISKGKSISKGD